jgi:acetate kinase
MDDVGPGAPCHVLALNAGSSSLKYGLFRVEGPIASPLFSGATRAADDPLAMEQVAQAMRSAGAAEPHFVAHRIVHGGPHLVHHAFIDRKVEEALNAATEFAPLHMPAALALLRAARTRFPTARHIACLDTAFHRCMPEIASTLALAAHWRTRGVRRYGFHGLSCASIVRRLRPALPERLVIAHLGNGASVSAIRGGCSVDTSMGLTPSGGLIMSSRSGDLDPGVLLYLMRAYRLELHELEAVVEHEGGLLGISGTTGDMRKLQEMAVTDASAGLAVAMFCRAVAKEVASMIVSLGGIDALIFTGGIGEHDAAVRQRVCADLLWADVRLDSAANEAGRGHIATSASRCTVSVMPAHEEQEMALEAAGLSGLPTKSLEH